MIGMLEGTVHAVTDQSLMLMVNGIGFELMVPTATYYTSQEKVTLHTYMHWNSDQGFSLFGFRSAEEKRLFCLLIECQGVGPKLALITLSSIGVDGLIDALIHKKKNVLSSVSGIGAKKAELIVLQLHEKVQQQVQLGLLRAGKNADQLTQVAQVLQSLNYTKVEITQAVDELRPLAAEPNVPFDQLLRKALMRMAKQNRSA